MLTSICHPSTGEQNKAWTAWWEPAEEMKWTSFLPTPHLPVAVKRFPVLLGSTRKSSCWFWISGAWSLHSPPITSRSGVQIQIYLFKTLNYFTNYSYCHTKSFLYSPLLQHGEENATGRKRGTVMGYEKIFPSRHKTSTCRQTVSRTELPSNTCNNDTHLTTVFWALQGPGFLDKPQEQHFGNHCPQSISTLLINERARYPTSAQSSTLCPSFYHRHIAEVNTCGI